ncbi:hypothetical protein GCM10020370_02010 [Paenibacillus hodogayensis]
MSLEWSPTTRRQSEPCMGLGLPFFLFRYCGEEFVSVDCQTAFGCPRMADKEKKGRLFIIRPARGKWWRRWCRTRA